MPVKKNKPTDGEQVQEYMNKLQHPLKEGFELLRNIIRQTDDRISERIKWNAPSYYYIDDFLTFGPQRDHRILLVFHHPAIMKVKSDLL
ncbi:MAG TPA: DUF1801 domain-containing protein, partial [Chitinophagaceae bacterium]|nr:DUF1801 domain-containing protein [Chitinophagaceae bacterium]